MKKVLTIYLYFILTIFISCDSGQKIEDSKRLVMVGTLHFPTDKVNADSIFKILATVSPDCILMEVDSSNFKDNFSFKEVYDENEYNAVLKYKEKHPKVDIRPIEFEGRNAYRKQNGLYSGAGQTFPVLNQVNRAKKFNSEEQKIWDTHVEYWEETEKIGQGNLYEINTPQSDAIVDSSKFFQYVKLKTIITNHEEFENKMLDAKGDSISIRNYYLKWANFEYKDRNEAMVENIIKTINSFPNKKNFVLLVGFHHRFYIKKELEKRDINFEIKEFYE